jgi:hypothetical protein
MAAGDCPVPFFPGTNSSGILIPKRIKVNIIINLFTSFF